MSKITRRNALARGGQAVAAAAVLSTLPSIAHAKEDAELFILYEEFKRLEKLEIAACKKADEAWVRVVRPFPSGAKWKPAVDEALRQAGVPALQKQSDAAVDASFDVLYRLYDIRANTPAGMILKFTVLWDDREHEDWRSKEHPITSISNAVEFDERAMEAVLMDLERLAGRAI